MRVKTYGKIQISGIGDMAGGDKYCGTFTGYCR
jgi:hypothetical protein